MNIDIGRILFKLAPTFKKDYDAFSQLHYHGTELDYGYVHGNNKIVFIKVGFHGTCYGYQNKYMKIARDLNKKYGCTVFVASNPTGLQDEFDDAMKRIQYYAKQHEWDDYQAYFMGHSLGATLGIMNAWRYPEIKKLVCINGPLNDDPNLIVPPIKQFAGEKMHLVYGDRDPSYNIAKLFKELESERMEMSFVHGTDHDFTNAMDLFMALPGMMLFGEEGGKNYGKL